MNKESKAMEIGYSGTSTEYQRSRKPRVQNTYNYKNKY
jgi:hypothetical protein